MNFARRAFCAATLVFYVTAMSERLLTGQIRDAVKQEVEQVQRAAGAIHWWFNFSRTYHVR